MAMFSELYEPADMARFHLQAAVQWYTLDEIADRMGLSRSFVSSIMYKGCGNVAKGTTQKLRKIAEKGEQERGLSDIAKFLASPDGQMEVARSRTTNSKVKKMKKGARA